MLRAILSNKCSKRLLNNFSLIYQEYGHPKDVLKLVQENLDHKLKENQVLLKMLMAPINPADINIIEGKYPITICLPAVAGNEGVFQIVDKGSNVKKFHIGDKVIPIKMDFGTWRSYSQAYENELIKIPQEISISEAAMFRVNTSSAYRLLLDYKKLKSGDYIVQNAANSHVGQSIIQLSKHFGYKTINIIRDRHDVDILVEHLKKLGADHIIIENLSKPGYEIEKTKELVSKLSEKAVIGFNAVGGKSLRLLTKFIANDSSIITYGGMSKEPLNIPTSSLLFKQHSYQGFWMTKWFENNWNTENFQKHCDELFYLVQHKIVQSPAVIEFPLESYKDAFSHIVNSINNPPSNTIKRSVFVAK